MSTINENLERLKSAKQAIQVALLNKGVYPWNVSFDEMADAIDTIQTGDPEREEELIEFASLPKTTTSVVVPNGIEYLPTYKFAKFNQLSDISMADVERIGEQCFQGCSALGSIDLSGVTTLDMAAFNTCTGLSEVELPSNIETIASSAFLNCTGLQTVYWDANTTVINNGVLKGCRGLQLVDFTMMTSVPTFGTSSSTVGDTNYIDIHEGLKIAVPNDLYETWAASGNWNNFKDYLYYYNEEGELEQPAAEVTPLCITLAEGETTPAYLYFSYKTTGKVIEYSLDGQNWQEFPDTYKYGAAYELASGSIYFRSNSSTFAGRIINYNSSGYGKVDISGNIMSLFNNDTELTIASQCAGLFRETNIRHAKDLILPANTTKNCYASLFEGNVNLISAPNLLAEDVVHGAYGSMFYGCTALTESPIIYAKTLSSENTDNGYGGPLYYMFYNCTSLNKITFLYENSDLATKVGSTYSQQYKYCQNWVQNVAASGTFVKSENAQWNISGISGIPSGWTVTTYQDSARNRRNLYKSKQLA